MRTSISGKRACCSAKSTPGQLPRQQLKRSLRRSRRAPAKRQPANGSRDAATTKPGCPRFAIQPVPIWIARRSTTRWCWGVPAGTSLSPIVALQLACITADTPNPPGGEIDRDERGEPNGVLRETAMALVRSIQPPPTDDELARALIGAGRNCLALGITSIGEPGVDPRTVNIYRRLDAEERLPLRCDVMAMTILPNGQRAAPPAPWHGRWAKSDTVKLFSDGGLSSGTAALSIPYRNRHNCGLPRFPAEQLAEEVRMIYDAGLAVAVHSIGDHVIGEVLDAFERLNVERSNVQRLRIEHFGLPNADHLRRARDLGVMVATQPSFLYDIGDTILYHLPEALVAQCYPFRSMFRRRPDRGF